MIRNIIFDFDGVILDSLTIKDKGFEMLFKDYPEDKVSLLIDFHKRNGGVSRFAKIRYFIEDIMGKTITNKEVADLAERFSELTLSELKNEKYRIKDSIDFIVNGHSKYNMHIASGSAESDLKILCKVHDIVKYFKSIHGSPMKKTDNIAEIIVQNNYLPEETVMIGDSINDYEAAKDNNISFIGYNNTELNSEKSAISYISSFKYFDSIIN